MSNRTEAVFIDLARVKVNGRVIDEEAMDHLYDIVIDLSMDVPGMAMLTFHDDENKIINDFKLGHSLEIDFSKSDDPMSYQNAFKGEVTAIEGNFGSGSMNDIELVIRAYDKSYRLHRETITKTWLNQKDSDIAKAIAGNVGLSPEVEATTEVFEHIYQNALTDMEFLKQRAARIGFEVFVNDEKLYFRKQDPTGSAVDLQWGENLHSFNTRLSIAQQVDEVIVKGWDPQKKKEIVGKATTSKAHPQVNTSWGGAEAKRAVSAASKLEVRQPVQSQKDADAVAKSILDSLNSQFIQAEGQTIVGMPQLAPGMLVNVKGIGTKFSGKYKLTSVRHVYSSGEFVTYFAIEGAVPEFISRMVADQNNEQNNRWHGVVPAIVTDNVVPDNDWGQVKVKYPWLDTRTDSFWARIAAPGIGNQRGIYFLPEINDEVLVAFEHGDFNRPYIIGGLYNGKDKPIEAIAAVTDGGNVKVRAIKTRTGHLIRFTDDQPGGMIEIIDAKQETSITMDTANKKIDIKSTGDITVAAKGNLTLTAEKDITIEATQNIKMEAKQNFTIDGMNVTAKAKSNVNLEGTAGANLKGATTKVEGLTQVQVTGPMAEVAGNATLTLRGGLVRIN